jgi:hypothetical protein
VLRLERPWAVQQNLSLQQLQQPPPLQEARFRAHGLHIRSCHRGWSLAVQSPLQCCCAPVERPSSGWRSREGLPHFLLQRHAVVQLRWLQLPRCWQGRLGRSRHSVLPLLIASELQRLNSMPNRPRPRQREPHHHVLAASALRRQLASQHLYYELLY